MRDQQTDEIVAYHEAGHAVAHVLLDVPVRWATIDPDAEAGNGGSVAGKPLPKYVYDWWEEGGLSPYSPVPLRVRDRIEREIMTLFAGELAQERQTGTTEGSAAYYDDPTHGIVIIDGDQRQIIRLVDTLSFGDDDRTAYYGWLRARTAALLGQELVWASVVAVADELLRRRHLTGAEVRSVVAESRQAWLGQNARRVIDG